MIEILKRRWDLLTTPMKIITLLTFFLLLNTGSEYFINNLKQSVILYKVIGSNTVSGTSSAVSVSTDTYYLDAKFEKSSTLTATLDNSLFVEETQLAKPTKKRPDIKKTLPDLPKTPLEYFVKKALVVDGIEKDGAFINGSYYLWNESIDTAISTNDGVYTPRLVKADQHNVTVSVNNKWFNLAVQP
tara:strand:+ start:1493 stop:2053 length:561 start_codon:yes stop_codon:yes gene_type:complete